MHKNALIKPNGKCWMNLIRKMKNVLLEEENDVLDAES